jgi:hypothetical protein
VKSQLTEEDKFFMYSFLYNDFVTMAMDKDMKYFSLQYGILQDTLTFFEEREDFEKCAVLLSLFQKWSQELEFNPKQRKSRSA